MFWFQTNLILITILFVIIILSFKKLYSLIFVFFFIISTVLNYIEYQNKVKIFTVKQSILAILVSITGFFLGSIRLIDLLTKYKKIVISILSPAFYFLGSHNNLFIHFKKYKYLIIDAFD